MSVRRKSLLSVFVVLLVAVAALLGAVRPRAVEAADPEPWIDPNQKTQFDKGPGWPAGWTPSAAPTELTADAVQAYKDARAVSDPSELPERLEMRVLQPLPPWTNEYPYKWYWSQLICGHTMYAYYFPFPDSGLILQAFDESYSIAVGSTGGAKCQFSPVVAIQYNPKETPEEKQQRELEDHVGASIYYARGDLGACYFRETEGAPENIYVCFNDGNASARFDAPAYLDTTVGRVRVPIRFISEMMKGTVDWEPTTQTITIRFPVVSRDVIKAVPNATSPPIELWHPDTYALDVNQFKWGIQTISQPERTIVLTIGSNQVLVDGKAVTIDAPPVIVPPGRTMVPVRFISEAMGAKVYWVGNQPIFGKSDGSLGGTYQVHIYTPFWPYFDAPNWYLDHRAVRF